MTDYWYESFITKSQRYCLIDDDGNIRATAPDFDGIIKAKQHYSWGKIHRMNFDGKNLTIGREVK